MRKRKVGIITGGGDCPGLNTVIDSLVKSLKNEYEIYGFIKSYEGMLNGEYIVLDSAFTGLHKFMGGTILKSVNQGNFSGKTKDGQKVALKPEVLKQTLKTYNELGLEALVVLGGDGTLSVAFQLQQAGLNIIGVPKSIDNDVFGTELTFGFLTAVEIAKEALDKLETTARSHERVMILEVMGRNSGWIGLYSGLAGGANVILIPEIPYDFEKIYEFINSRRALDKTHTLIVISEGATRKGGSKVYSKTGGLSSENLLGGAGELLASELNHRKIDSRATRLGHVQRGGSPTGYDRILSIQMGMAAADMVVKKQYNFMVSFQEGKISKTNLEFAVKDVKKVNPESSLIVSSKKMGVFYGD